MLLSIHENIPLFIISTFTAFFAIMNPIANTPIYIGLTKDLTLQNRRKVARQSVIIAFIIVAIFAIGGNYIFKLFGLTIPAFKITGGILIFYVGFEMLQSQSSNIHSHKAEADESALSVAVSPLATPILAGPGTIVTALNFTTKGYFLDVLITIAMLAVMLFLTFIAFIFSDKLVKYLGENLIKVIGKIMGLILAVMGTGMVIGGIQLIK
ncbi:MAG: MarC family protein [Hyphomicrobiales bacterium]